VLLAELLSSLAPERIRTWVAATVVQLKVAVPFSAPTVGFAVKLVMPRAGGAFTVTVTVAVASPFGFLAVRV
jgi:hypothetical protein